MKNLCALLLAFAIIPSLFAQSNWPQTDGLEPGFRALRERVENERAARAGDFHRLPDGLPQTQGRDVLAACPELDVRYYTRPTLGQSVAAVQACVDRVYGAAAAEGLRVTVRPGMLGTADCGRGILCRASLTQTTGIRIEVAGRMPLIERTVAELSYAVMVQRGGKLLDWNSDVTTSTRQ